MSLLTRIRRQLAKERRALLMIVVGNREKQRYAPPNFWRWSYRAQYHYLTRRWPTWEWCGNGQPLDTSGGEFLTPPEL